MVFPLKGFHFSKCFSLLPKSLKKIVSKSSSTNSYNAILEEVGFFQISKEKFKYFSSRVRRKT